MSYIEQACNVTFGGHTFTNDGAVITDKHATCYLSHDGHRVTDWHGKQLGTYIITSTWRTARSFISRTMSQAEVTIDGVTYTGRTTGVGMVFNGKRKAKR